MEIIKDSDDKNWGIWVKGILAGFITGVVAGMFLTNITYTHALMKDCELMKQFRVNNLAYDCKVK